MQGTKRRTTSMIDDDCDEKKDVDEDLDFAEDSAGETYLMYASANPPRAPPPYVKQALESLPADKKSQLQMRFPAAAHVFSEKNDVKVEEVNDEIKDFKTVHVIGDGHCFRRALAFLLHNNESLHSSVLEHLIDVATKLSGQSRDNFVRSLFFDFHPTTRANRDNHADYCIIKCRNNQRFYAHFARKYLSHWSCQGTLDLLKFAYPDYDVVLHEPGILPWHSQEQNPPLPVLRLVNRGSHYDALVSRDSNLSARPELESTLEEFIAAMQLEEYLREVPVASPQLNEAHTQQNEIILTPDGLCKHLDKVQIALESLSSEGSACINQEQLNNACRILFLGSIGSGKTTLLNTLLGEELLPHEGMGDETDTLTPVEIIHHAHLPSGVYKLEVFLKTEDEFFTDLIIFLRQMGYLLSNARAKSIGTRSSSDVINAVLPSAYIVDADFEIISDEAALENSTALARLSGYSAVRAALNLKVVTVQLSSVNEAQASLDLLCRSHCSEREDPFFQPQPHNLLRELCALGDPWALINCIRVTANFPSAIVPTLTHLVDTPGLGNIQEESVFQSICRYLDRLPGMLVSEVWYCVAQKRANSSPMSTQEVLGLADRYSLENVRVVITQCDVVPDLMNQCPVCLDSNLEGKQRHLCTRQNQFKEKCWSNMQDRFVSESHQKNPQESKKDIQEKLKSILDKWGATVQKKMTFISAYCKKNPLAYPSVVSSNVDGLVLPLQRLIQETLVKIVEDIHKFAKQHIVPLLKQAVPRTNLAPSVAQQTLDQVLTIIENKLKTGYDLASGLKAFVPKSFYDAVHGLAPQTIKALCQHGGRVKRRVGSLDIYQQLISPHMRMILIEAKDCAFTSLEKLLPGSEKLALKKVRQMPQHAVDVILSDALFEQLPMKAFWRNCLSVFQNSKANQKTQGAQKAICDDVAAAFRSAIGPALKRFHEIEISRFGAALIQSMEVLEATEIYGMMMSNADKFLQNLQRVVSQEHFGIILSDSWLQSAKNLLQQSPAKPSLVPAKNYGPKAVRIHTPVSGYSSERVQHEFLFRGLFAQSESADSTFQGIFNLLQSLLRSTDCDLVDNPRLCALVSASPFVVSELMVRLQQENQNELMIDEDELPPQIVLDQKSFELLEKVGTAVRECMCRSDELSSEEQVAMDIHLGASHLLKFERLRLYVNKNSNFNQSWRNYLTLCGQSDDAPNTPAFSFMDWRRWVCFSSSRPNLSSDRFELSLARSRTMAASLFCNPYVSVSKCIESALMYAVGERFRVTNKRPIDLAYDHLGISKKCGDLIGVLVMYKVNSMYMRAEHGKSVFDIEKLTCDGLLPCNPRFLSNAEVAFYGNLPQDQAGVALVHRLRIPNLNSLNAILLEDYGIDSMLSQDYIRLHLLITDLVAAKDKEKKYATTKLLKFLARCAAQKLQQLLSTSEYKGITLDINSRVFQ